MKHYESPYERYVRKYCEQHNITKAEAEQHAMVKNVKEYYEEQERGRVQK